MGDNNSAVQITSRQAVPVLPSIYGLPLVVLYFNENIGMLDFRKEAPVPLLPLLQTSFVRTEE